MEDKERKECKYKFKTINKFDTFCSKFSSTKELVKCNNDLEAKLVQSNARLEVALKFINKIISYQSNSCNCNLQSTSCRDYSLCVLSSEAQSIIDKINNIS